MFSDHFYLSVSVSKTVNLSDVQSQHFQAESGLAPPAPRVIEARDCVRQYSFVNSNFFSPLSRLFLVRKARRRLLNIFPKHFEWSEIALVDVKSRV